MPTKLSTARFDAHTSVSSFPTFSFSVHQPTHLRRRKEAKRRDVGDDGGGALLARGGDDLHRLLQHLRRAGAELPQGALQVRGRVPREGPLLRRQVDGRQAGEAQ